MKPKQFLFPGMALIAGLVIVVVLVQLREPPQQSESGFSPRSVRVMNASPMEVMVTASGYGNARPDKSWRALARVGGRVIERHPNLESGNLITEGTQLLQIDPTRYELAITGAHADIATIRSEQNQLDQREENTGKLLELEKRRLELAEKELQRTRELAERGNVSRNQLDEHKRATLQQRKAVQSLENELAMIPSQREHLEARLARAGSALEQAREDLEDTGFTAPFDLRMHETSVEVDEDVQPGQKLFIADSIGAAEVTVQIPVPELRRLLSHTHTSPSPPLSNDKLENLHRDIDLGAIRARLNLAGQENITWPARVTRIASGLDPKTRTVQVVLSVDEPYRNANPPEQPPLVRGMYVRARLAVTTTEKMFAVPASAVHDGSLYLVTDENRLNKRSVQVAWTQRDIALIRDGLQPGEPVILDDLVPAIEGTRVKPNIDREATERLRKRARSPAP